VAVETTQVRKHIKTKQYKNTVETLQNTINTSIHITKTNTHYKSHTYIHSHITKQVKTTQYKSQQPQFKIHPNETVTV
jgi:hypothetical protein